MEDQIHLPGEFDEIASEAFFHRVKAVEGMGFRDDARYAHQVKDAASLFLGPEDEVPAHQIGGFFIR